MIWSIFNNVTLKINGLKILMRINIIGLLILIFHSCGFGDCALQGVQLIVEPPTVRRGHHATFRCLYDMNGASLYSVKFYRGQLEFYRYTPDEKPSTKVFPYPGFNIDVSMSNASQVVIRNVGFGLSGNFSCEVTADAPFFSTATAFVHMQVVELPEKRPEVWTEQNHYEIGEVLKANCTTPPSRPKAFLKFTLNNIAIQTAEPEYTRTIDNLFISRISLRLRLQGIHFTTVNHANGPAYSTTNFGGQLLNFISPSSGSSGIGSLLLRCTAQVGDFYQETTEVELGGLQKDPVPARVTSSSSSKPKSFLLQLQKGLTNLLPSVLPAESALTTFPFSVISFSSTLIGSLNLIQNYFR